MRTGSVGKFAHGPAVSYPLLTVSFSVRGKQCTYEDTPACMCKLHWPVLKSCSSAMAYVPAFRWSYLGKSFQRPCGSTWDHFSGGNLGSRDPEPSLEWRVQCGLWMSMSCWSCGLFISRKCSLRRTRVGSSKLCIPEQGPSLPTAKGCTAYSSQLLKSS